MSGNLTFRPRSPTPVRVLSDAGLSEEVRTLTFAKFLELVAILATHRAGGEAHHAFRQSIINDLEMHCGYSAARAEQVVDLFETRARRQAA